MKKNSRIQLIFACSVAIALLGLAFTRNLIDFPVYYAAGRSLISWRTDLYSPDFALGRVMDYRYPPFFLIALYPLWLITYSAAAYIWYLLSVFEVIGCVLIVRRTFPALRESNMKMWLVVALAMCQYFVMALHYGNAHLLATFLLFASLYFMLREKNLVAAVLMALAITIKLTSVFFLPYLALKKRWMLLAEICVFVIALNLAPTAYFGFRGNNELLVTWYRHVVASQEFHEDNGPINLSLKGQLRRYLSTVDYSQRVDADVRYPDVNLASLSRGRLVGLWEVIAAGLFAGVFLIIWWRGDGSTGHGYRSGSKPSAPGGFLPHEMALMICLMLLAEPLTPKIYFISLLWPVAALTSFAVCRATRKGRFANRALIVVAVINSVLPLLPGRSVQRLLLVLGVDFYVNCLVMTTLIFLLVSRSRPLQTQSAELQTQAPSGARMP